MSTLPVITGGLYLVLNPDIPRPVLLNKLEQALEGGVDIVQLWNNWPASYTYLEKIKLIESVNPLVAAYQVPLLINEEWQLIRDAPISGIHFDRIPQNYEQIKSRIGRKFLAGITCSNDLQVIRWADENQLDYVSFCSVFPSASVQSCELVDPQTIHKAREITRMPIFLSGGIKLDTIHKLREYDFAGIALISGIVNAENPKQTTTQYKQALTNLTR
jgi:thiamine-phosphate pyrophosphorylase